MDNALPISKYNIKVSTREVGQGPTLQNLLRLNLAGQEGV